MEMRPCRVRLMKSKLVIGTRIWPVPEVNPKESMGSCISVSIPTFSIVPKWLHIGFPCTSVTNKLMMTVVLGEMVEISGSSMKVDRVSTVPHCVQGMMNPGRSRANSL